MKRRRKKEREMVRNGKVFPGKGGKEFLVGNGRSLRRSECQIPDKNPRKVLRSKEGKSD